MSKQQKKYNNIIDAWLHVLGDYFYFGYFDTENLTLTEAVNNLYKYLMATGGINTDSRVLCVGWGIGEMEFYIYETIGCEVTRIYNDRERICTAIQRCQKKGYTQKIHFHTCDPLTGYFPDNCFDVVLSFESSIFFNDKKSFIADCFRILRKGGRMVFSDTMLAKDLTLADIFFNYQQEMLNQEKTWGRMKMESLTTYKAQMLENQFCEVESRDISSLVVPTLSRWKKTVIVNKKLLEEVITPERIDEFISSCEVMQKFFDDKFFCYGVVTGIKMPVC